MTLTPFHHFSIENGWKNRSVVSNKFTKKGIVGSFRPGHLKNNGMSLDVK